MEKSEVTSTHYFKGCVIFRFIDFSKIEVLDLNGIKERLAITYTKYVYMTFVLNLAALKTIRS